MELTIGTKVFNHGDRANPSHFGTITKVNGRSMLITPEPDAELTPYYVEAYNFSEKYEGNGMTRLVTAMAYDKWFNDRINKMPSHL